MDYRRTVSSDYLETENRRSGIATVSWGGNFRKIAGGRIVGRRVFRNRIIVFFIALLILGIGLGSVFF